MQLLKLLSFILISIFIQQTSFSKEVKVFEFTANELETLDKRKIKGETIYTLGANEKGNFI